MNITQLVDFSYLSIESDATIFIINAGNILGRNLQGLYKLLSICGLCLEGSITHFKLINRVW